MSKLKAGIIGSITSIGWQLRSTGTSIDLFATIEVKLGNQVGNSEESIQKANKRMKALTKKLLGKKIQIYAV